MQVLAVTIDGTRWRWQIIEDGTVIEESHLSFETMDEALQYGNAYAEVMEGRTAQNLGARLRRRPHRTAQGL